jgi:hypothetical protein
VRYYRFRSRTTRDGDDQRKEMRGSSFVAAGIDAGSILDP